jgi:hypothetical protein
MKGFVVSNGPDDVFVLVLLPFRFVGEPAIELARDMLFIPEAREGVRGVRATSERARVLLGVLGTCDMVVLVKVRRGKHEVTAKNQTRVRCHVCAPRCLRTGGSGVGTRRVADHLISVFISKITLTVIYIQICDWFKINKTTFREGDTLTEMKEGADLKSEENNEKYRVQQSSMYQYRAERV